MRAQVVTQSVQEINDGMEAGRSPGSYTHTHTHTHTQIHIHIYTHTHTYDLYHVHNVLLLLLLLSDSISNANTMGSRRSKMCLGLTLNISTTIAGVSLHGSIVGPASGYARLQVSE